MTTADLNGFMTAEVLPGIFHITDRMGVAMTLLCGSERALLIDTGYGLTDVKQVADSVTNLPYDVILTHGHHDHALGAMCFETTYMFPEEEPVLAEFSDRFHRQRVVDQAKAKGIEIADPEAYLTKPIPKPLPLEEGALDLGGITAEIIKCPGHTPGSAIIWIPERRLLLTSDNWNPCTWLFFEGCAPVRQYLADMRSIVSRLCPEYVLCPHQPKLFGADKLKYFLDGLTDEALAAAQRVSIPPWDNINTHRCELPDGQFIVFDMDKYSPDNRH